MKKKLLFNSLSSTTLYVVNVAVAFVMSPVYIRALGNRDFGLWELIMSVVGYMGLLDFGVGTALIQFVSVADGRQDRDDLQQTISTSFAFFLLIAVVALLVFILLSCFPWLITGNETEDINKLGAIFTLLGFNTALVFPLQVFTATLMGVQRHYFINSARVLLLVVNAGMNYYLLQHFVGHGLLVMALITPVFTAIQLILFAGAIYFDKRIPALSLRGVNVRKVKELLSFGGKTVTMMAASRLQNQTVPFIIGNVIGLGHIVYFLMPNRLVDYAKGLSQALGLPLAPYFGSAIGKGDHKAVIDSWLQSSLALQVVALAMPIVIIFNGENFLTLWLGSEYSAAGRIVLYVLVVGLLADSLASNAFRILTAKGRHGKAALIWLILSAASIPLGVMGAYFFGVTGVAIVVTVVSFVGNLVTLYMACAAMRVSLLTYFNRTLSRLIVPLIMLIISFLTFKSIFTKVSYSYIIIGVLFSGCVYVVFIWFITLEYENRARIKGYIKNLVQD